MRNINKKLPITNPIHQELLRVPCETHQLLVSHICTASECQKRFMCSKCLMNDAKHNKSHHPKFNDLANFFKHYENQKDSNMALVEDDMLELRLKKEKASKNIKILNEQKNILTSKLEEISINFFNECEKKFLENFNLFKKDFQKNIAIFFETKLQSFKIYEENLENEIIKLDVTSNKIGFKEGMMRSSSLSNNKKDFKRSFSQENYLKQIIENMINAVQGHKISNDVFSKEIDSYMEKG